MAINPGPWSIAPGVYVMDYGGSSEEFIDVRDDIGTTICLVWAGDTEGLHTARLISAAPEMITALKAAHHALRSYQYGNSSPELAEQTADACAAAIAKSEGKTS